MSVSKREDWGAIAAHAAPFAAWLLLMFVLGEAAGWTYAVRSLVCLGFFLALRPWRWYGPLNAVHLAPAIGVGLLVFVVWVVPESAIFGRWPGLQSVYLKYFAVQPWFAPRPPTGSVFDPAVCGWTLALTRLLGSALVIGVIEEFFWRGFIYRWLQARDFTAVSLGALQWPLLLAVSLAFGLEHDRWLAGIVAGLAYGLLMIRTRDLWATALAHAVTNGALGVYVLVTGAYGFW